MDSSEHALIEAARAGDGPALEALLTLHAPAVLRFGQKMCRHPEDAQDVLQEALLAAARSVRDFRGDSSFATWLFTIVRSFCIKKRRVSKFAPTETVSLDHDAGAARIASSAPLPDEAAADHELSHALNEAIAELEEANREVLLLRDVEGMTAPEVASVLGISVDAVKSRLHRARVQVRARLEPLLPAPERLSAAGPECPEIALLFSRYIEGEIGETECAAMEKHVASCARFGRRCSTTLRATRGRGLRPSSISSASVPRAGSRTSVPGPATSRSASRGACRRAASTPSTSSPTWCGTSPSGPSASTSRSSRPSSRPRRTRRFPPRSTSY